MNEQTKYFEFHVVGSGYREAWKKFPDSSLIRTNISLACGILKTANEHQS